MASMRRGTLRLEIGSRVVLSVPKLVLLQLDGCRGHRDEPLVFARFVFGLQDWLQVGHGSGGDYRV